MVWVPQSTLGCRAGSQITSNSNKHQSKTTEFGSRVNSGILPWLPDHKKSISQNQVNKIPVLISEHACGPEDQANFELV